MNQPPVPGLPKNLPLRWGEAPPSHATPKPCWARRSLAPPGSWAPRLATTPRLLSLSSATRFRLACLLLLLGAVAVSQAGSFSVPAWAFDRGNVRVFTEEYADAGPMVAFGGQSPVVVEYDLELPLTARYALELCYAAASARPVRFRLDGQEVGLVCRTATGSWNTSGATWETSASLVLTAGKHRLRFERENDFPHLVSLRFGSPDLPPDFVPVRPNACKLPASDTGARSRGYVAEVAVEALRLAIADLTATFGARYPCGEEFAQRLAGLEASLKEPATAAVAKASLAALAREALLANPLLDFDQLLVLRRAFPTPPAARRAMGQALGVGSLNAHTSDDTPRQGHWNDALAILSRLRGTPELTVLHQPANQETVIDPVLHFDADRLLFAQNGAQQKNWRLWEIGVDGRGLCQVTPDDGMDVAHFDPCYLPDGRIIFASTAVYQGLPCEFGAQAMTCLYLLDPRRATIRQLTFEQDSDWCPTMLPNGRVLYLRWEYTDQSHANSRILFHMNPDGTDQREFRGSGSWFPGSFFYAKPVPGHPHEVIGVAGGHHGTPRSGRLLILDPTLGRREAEGVVQEIPGRGALVEPIVRDRLVDGVWPQFLMPYPLSPKYHLVSAKLAPDALWGLYLVDVFDNVTLIHEIEGAALLWPIALQATPRPPIIPDRVNLASDQATVFITDLHTGPGLEGVPRGTVKRLRIIEYYFSRRGFGGLYGTLGQDGPWDVKRILGTVPVEPDGSAHFTIPANSPLTLQPLDGQGQALQLMRSWFVGMPGEAVSCGGCHEPQNEVSPNRRALAALREPSPIEPWHGPARGFGFLREVQPVLDQHCVRCHDGSDGSDRSVGSTPPSQPELAGAVRRPAPYLKGDRWLTDWSSQLAGRWDGGGKFTESYFQLQRYVRRPGIEGDRRMFTPLDYHFSTTELGQLLRHGHHGVQLDAEGWERLAAWVDLNAPFYGRWGEIPQFGPEPAGAERLARVHERAMELRRKYVPMGPHPDYEAAPETPSYPAGSPEGAQAQVPSPLAQVQDSTLDPRTSPSRPSAPTVTYAGWPFDAAEAAGQQQAAAVDGRVAWHLDLGEGSTLELVRIPGGRFVMETVEAGTDDTSQKIVEIEPFWMARCETTNRQYRRFQPGHESRTEDRHGYQFGVVGYDQDQPGQPVVRVSWLEAIGFCEWLSTRTGLRITLPTEPQWEWACRAGAATPFWFGPLDADYAPYANLGDKRLAEFAADTALDNYTSARPMVNPNRYDAWIPRDDRFNDGGFVTQPVGSYQANPWGLQDMHGNVWEWTRSPWYSASAPGTTETTLPADGSPVGQSSAEPLRRGRMQGSTESRPTGSMASVRNHSLSVTTSHEPERVVRGGSWYDRPHRCTSNSRLSYPAWQRVFNVGFRVVCEDEEPKARGLASAP